MHAKKQQNFLFIRDRGFWFFAECVHPGQLARHLSWEESSAQQK